jgi:hypothetical protein
VQIFLNGLHDFYLYIISVSLIRSYDFDEFSTRLAQKWSQNSLGYGVPKIYSHGHDIPRLGLGTWTYFRIILSCCVTMRFCFVTGYGWKAAAYVMWSLVKGGLTCQLKHAYKTWTVLLECQKRSFCLLLFISHIKMDGTFWYKTITNPVARRSYKYNVAHII